jgi:hypothetical protein
MLHGVNSGKGNVSLRCEMIISTKMNCVVLRRPVSCSEFCYYVFYGNQLPSFLSALSGAFSNTLTIGQRVISKIKISNRRMGGV